MNIYRFKLLYMVSYFTVLIYGAEYKPSNPLNTIFLKTALENPRDIHFERLLVAGADLNCTDTNGNDALMIIVKKYGDAQLQTIRFLLDKGINFHLNSHNESVISIARENYFSCAKTFEIFRYHIWPAPQNISS